METITPVQLLAAYAQGYFPMGKSQDDPALHWYYPEQRGIIPLEEFHVPVSLAKYLRKNPFTYTANKAFPEVIAGCAERQETWINSTILSLYTELWVMGYAHSIECWQGEKLVGGLYGVALGGAFFGESMFSLVPSASKAALVELVSRLKKAGYTLLDAQYVNVHLLQFGVQEIPRIDYLKRLHAALAITPHEAFMTN